MGAKEPSRFDIQVSAGLFHILDSPVRPAPEFLGNQTARHADTFSKFRPIKATCGKGEEHVIANDLLEREANVFNTFSICSHA